MEEFVLYKFIKLRGSVRIVRNDKFFECLFELLVVDVFEMVDDDEEKFGDR